MLPVEVLQLIERCNYIFDNDTSVGILLMKVIFLNRR